TITSTQITTATVDELYTYDVDATDLDGDTLTYSLTTNPSGMTINSTTGVISWTPNSGQIGYNNVAVEVSDGGLSDNQSFVIEVIEAEGPGYTPTPGINHAPTITSTPITTVTVDDLYVYGVNATDPDGDTLTYSLTTKPTGMTINSTTGLINWTPTSTGDYDITVRVSDGSLFDTQSFTITVEEVDEIEEIASEILETQELGAQYFEQLESQNDPNALQKTIDYLKTQPNVDNAEVGEDGVSIWVEYKSGVEGIILIEPFGSLGGLPTSTSYRSNFPTTSAKTTSTNQKAIILLPFYSVQNYEDESVDVISSYLMQCGYSESSIETYRGDEVTANLIETLCNYDFIYMATHGGVDPNGQVNIVIGEAVNVISMALLWNRLTGDTKEISIASIPAKFWGIDVPRIVFALHPRFFTHCTYPGSFVYMNACSSLKYDSLADAFLYSGASVYLGWDNVSFLDCGNLHNPEFFQELSKPNNTLQQAYDATFAKYYPASVYKDTNHNCEWHVVFEDGEEHGDSNDTTFDYFLNIEFRGDSQFILNPQQAPTPTPILSPVVGDLEIVNSAEQCLITKWCFNQHKTCFTGGIGHCPGGGICKADDTYAWDANLNTPIHDSDKGRSVYAVEQGIVSQTYGSCTGGSYGQVLIEHKYQGNSWWSGYVHLKDIQVIYGQSVDENTLIGYISSTGTDNNHLHFVVYKGQNSQAGLISFDAEITPREGGQISGSVKDAVIQSPLQDVSIKVYDGNSLISSGTTDSNGVYSIPPVPAGSGYRAEFTKSGYIPAIYYDISVVANVTTYLETVLQIDDNYSGEGNISGTISNALTGEGVSGLTIKLREGINVTSGTVIASTTTETEGYYSVTNLNAGYYTAEVSGTGYNTTYFTVICIGGTTTDNQNANITPVLLPGEIRIILTWGAIPPDIDSHLTGPLPGGTRFHMYYPDAEANYGSPWPEYVKLDRDDVDSYGPETTTIYQQIPGVYRFSVHDYTNRESSYSTALSNSGAQVRVYRGDNLIATFNVPANQEGTLWTVFEMDGDTITPINTMSYESNPSDVRNVRKSIAPDAELMKNLPPKR
ncbi:MAG: carboxypeptidase regulatory-like domain-containing protein, partial [Bacteroidetes bacterium]|nr:carboxypeptidase regulatory-like domain-containing protein [Bacteroidota bacterium]